MSYTRQAYIQLVKLKWHIAEFLDKNTRTL